MLKLRLKKIGRKKYPVYRVVVMKSSTKRDGRPIDEVGYYNTITKEVVLNKTKIRKWLNYGVKPTQTVFYLLKKENITQD